VAETVGSVEGIIVGTKVTSETGAAVGTFACAVVGAPDAGEVVDVGVGVPNGELVGTARPDGCDGLTEGVADAMGDTDGAPVVLAAVGTIVGLMVGLQLGKVVGSLDGLDVGEGVGTGLGFTLGR
jgi:hypothetical protein